MAGTKLTLAGTQIDLRFTPTANRDTAATFQYVVVDPQGEVDSAQSTVTINVTAVNDAPTATSKTFNNQPESTPIQFAVSDFGFTDPDTGDSISNVQFATLPANGRLKLNGTDVLTGTDIAVSEITAGNLVYTPANKTANY